jgi:hypothetical protein
MEAVSTVTLAHPNGGPPLPYGTPVQVDEGDSFTKAHLDAGMLVPVHTDRPTQVWDEHAEAISTGAASDLGGVVSPLAQDAPPPPDDKADEPQAKKKG